jgi:fermentation-respiration switch protein FrsA (DUF1100 family)
MKKVLHVAAIALVALSLNSCLAGKYMSDYALKPTPHGVDDIERTRHKADSLMPGSTAWYDDLKAQGILKDAWTTSDEGYKLHACYVPAAKPEEAQGTAIVVHGYTDNHFVFLYLVRMYRDTFNYNVLFPDLQYHGYSEGDEIQMGWKDRLDVMKWIEVAHEKFNDDFMVLHGVSMGAATVMLTSGEKLPDYVKCFVEDCGYCSVTDQFKKNLDDMSKLLPNVIITSASIVSGKEFGWKFEEADCRKALAKCEKPMLFIHGDADDFVPFSHLDENYNAKIHGYKVKWVAPGAVHANSYAKYPEEYTRQVSNFLKTVHNMIAVGNL